jgi:hypothetical protein
LLSRQVEHLGPKHAQSLVVQASLVHEVAQGSTLGPRQAVVVEHRAQQRFHFVRTHAR